MAYTYIPTAGTELLQRDTAVTDTVRSKQTRPLFSQHHSISKLWAESYVRYEHNYCHKGLYYGPVSPAYNPISTVIQTSRTLRVI